MNNPIMMTEEACDVRGGQPSVLWTFYLLTAIVMVGLPGCLTIAPFILLGRFVRPLELWAGRAACAAIRFMLNLNVWLKKDVRFSVPPKIGRTNTPCLFVANHRSNLDVFFLISHIPNIRIVAKSSLFFVPFLGGMMWVMRQIPVRRGRFDSTLKVLCKIKLGLAKGDPILIFAEGRRCEPGYKGTLRFHDALFKFAFVERIAVTPVVFANTDAVWPKGSVRINAAAKATVRSLPPVHPEAYVDYKAFMASVRQQMEACLERCG